MINFQPKAWAHLTDDVLPRDAVVAIDGPAGSGKSTTAKALAKRFNLLYIDTGAMYRALTLAALQAGIDCARESSLVELATNANLELKTGRGESIVFWDGKDVSEAIRAPEIDAMVSLVASHPEVRGIMVRHQQSLGRRGGVVMEGRDIGSVVFPLATSKVFLHASLEARVERRFKQNQQRGHEISREDLTKDLAHRDLQDSERATSPLAISPDAHVIDSSQMSLEQQNEACALACLVNPALDLELDTDEVAAQRSLPFKYRFPFACFNGVSRFFGLKEVGTHGKAVPGGCIIACNHTSLWDPPLIGSTFRRYKINTLAKESLFKIPIMGPFIRYIDGIPIKRKSFDKNAFAEASKSLLEGNNLLIFPEGTRRAIGHPGPVRNGLGILVQATGAPMIPVFLRGSYGRMPLGSTVSPLEANYGPVIRWHGLEALLQQFDKKDVSRRIANLCQAAYEELQARSYVRFPQTEFEKELGAKQLLKVAAKEKKIFGR
jgi:CMP/dCMP kinase